MSCEDDGFHPDEDTFIAVLNFTMTFGIISANCFILLVIVCNWKQIRRCCTNKSSVILTINLSVSELLMGFLDFYFSLPMYICDMALYLGHHKLGCIMRFTLIMTASAASGLTLIAIAVERYIYVVHALRYSEILSTRRTLWIISLVWATAFLYTFPLYFWNQWNDDLGTCGDVEVVPMEYAVVFSAVRIFVFIILIIIFHWRVHRQALKVQCRHDPMGTVSALRTRSARVLMTICFVYFISWLPFTVTSLCRKNGVAVPSLFYKLSLSCINISFLVNPFVYACTNRPIKGAILGTLTFMDNKCKILCGFMSAHKEVSISCDATFAGNLQRTSAFI